VWKSTWNGRTLHFRLVGINNQNFIMRDDETGSWWQQVSGRAILGPLAGEQLEQVHSDEVTFAVWKKEHPATLVLLGDEAYKDEYASPDWEKKMADAPTVRPGDPGDPLKPRDLVVGVRFGEEAVAYPWAALDEHRSIADTVGGTPILILLDADGRSMRCFDRRLEGRTLDLSPAAGGAPPVRDATTGSAWDFSGVATEGPLSGTRLRRVRCLKDFWFDWKAYNPSTRVFSGPSSTSAG
jgi:hypothetical protein